MQQRYQCCSLGYSQPVFFGTSLSATYMLGMVNVICSVTLYNAKVIGVVIDRSPCLSSNLNFLGIHLYPAQTAQGLEDMVV